MTVAVLGAGAFGTALAIAVSHNGPVTLWTRDADHCAEMAGTRTNARRLPGHTLSPNIAICHELETALQADLVLFCVPMQSLGFLVQDLDLSGCVAVACCKGIDIASGRGPSRILSSAGTVAVLTGPSFAADIAGGLPTALTLACVDTVRGAEIQTKLSTPSLRIYRSQDIAGAELGGALKNVIAIGCGAVMGAGLGDSARAALMTRGFTEMQRVAASAGAHPDTLNGLSGFGDLALTCTSDQSRNYRLGFALGAGDDFDAAITVEGAATARALRGVARDHNLDLPVSMAIADLVEGTVDVQGAMARLMARPLKEE